jgi:hypothetical protein
MDWFCRDCKFSGLWEDLEPDENHEVFCISCGGWLDVDPEFVEGIIVPKVKKRDEAYRRAVEIYSNGTREWIKMMADLEHENSKEENEK